MGEERLLPDDVDERLYDVLLDYLEAAERGEPRNPEEIVARHPEFASELREFLEARKRVEDLAAPLRWLSLSAADWNEDTHLSINDVTCAAVLPVPSRPKSFGNYDVLEPIGRGGMCVVYKAWHRGLNRYVALKTVRNSRLSDEDVLRRFRNEAETVAALDHPNIVPIHEIDEEDGQLFFSMKLLEGGSLKDRLEEFTTDPAAAARLVALVARAIGYAHRRGVLHRDLKPSNVLLDAEGRPHVSDFGLAKWLGNENDLTQTGALLGTPSYMAPEQTSPIPRPRPGAEPGPARGPYDAVTTAADIYGLGALLYALVTGSPPFRAPTLLLTLEQVRKELPTSPRQINPRVDRDLETVCLKCLEKDPGRRYGSADELAEDLERWLGNEPVRARRATLLRRIWLLSRRHPVRATMAAAAAIFVPVLIATLATAVVSVARERDRALAQEALAEKREKEVLRQLYATDMAQAHRNWRQGDVNGLKYLLDRWRPEKGGDDLRDCAWRLLDPLQRPDPLFPPDSDSVHKDAVYHVAISTDGRAIASASKDGTIHVRRRDRDDLVLIGHRDEVNWVAFDRDGNRIASASDDGSVRVWDALSGRELLTLRGHQGEVVAVEFTADGKALLSAGRDGTLRRWRLPGGDPAETIRASNDRIAAIAPAPDGRHVATVSKDSQLQVFDSVTGAAVVTRPLAGQAQCVAYSPNGQLIAAGDIAGHVWLVAAGDGEPLRMFSCDNGCSVEGLAFAPDGNTLAFCGLHGRVRLWDLRHNELRRNLDCENHRMWCATFTSEGRTLLCGADDGSIRTWKLAEAHSSRCLPAARSTNCTSIAFSPDGATLAVAGSDGVITFWDPRTCSEQIGRPPLRLSLQGSYGIRFEGRGSVLGVDKPDESFERWDLSNAAAPSRLNSPGQHRSSLCLRPGTVEWLIAGEGASLYRWDATSDRRTIMEQGTERCSSAGWSPDGKILALSFPGRVRLLREGTETIADLELHRRFWGSPAITFSPDGKTVAAVDFGGLIRLWDAATGTKGAVLQGRQLAVQSIAFSPDGKILAVGGEDGTVKIWDIASGRELFTLKVRQGGRIFALAFAPDGHCLAAACENHDGTKEVAIWPAGEL